MDILKYLDVLIGLAVVMVLLSPVVTAFTQAVMWARCKRSRFLCDGVKDLIRHLDPRPVAVIEVEDAAGVPVAGILVAGMLPGLPKDSPVDFENGIEAEGVPDRIVRLTCTNPAGPPLVGHIVTLRFIPQKGSAPHAIKSEPTSAEGKTTIDYAGGAAGHGSYEADVVVHANQSVAAGATVEWETAGGKGTIPDQAGGMLFSYPNAPDTAAPGRYAIACTVKDYQGNLAPDQTVTFTFHRNRAFDVVVQKSSPTDESGVASLTLPAPIQPRLTADGVAEALATAVLCHPMVAKGNPHRLLRWMPRWLLPALSDRKGDVVTREELIRLLLELAANEGAGASNLDPEIRQAFQRILRMNGIPMPGRTLSDIRKEAQGLERDHPGDSVSVRQTKAIITAAQSDFVGKINNWFDQTMARVTQRYGAYARFVTIFSAAIVAFSLQFDSLELLRRLSIDGTLRTSLLEEGKVQQARIETMEKSEADRAKSEAAAAKTQAEATKTQTAQTQGQNTASDNSDEIAAIKAKRDEIDETLAKLRAPSLAILPDHFLWQPVPEARLPRNPFWTHQFPQRYELVAGGASYPVTPRWQEDVFKDLKVAIDASDAPVTATIEDHGVGVVFVASEPSQLRVCAHDEKVACGDGTMAQGFRDVAEASLVFKGKWRAREPGTSIVLVVDDGKPVPVAFDDTKTQMPEALTALGEAIEAAVPKPKLFTRVEKDKLTITAGDPGVRLIRLLWSSNNPFSNVLTARARVASAWLVKAADLGKAVNKSLTVTISPGATLDIPVQQWTSGASGSRTADVERLVDFINAGAGDAKVAAAVHRDDALLLRATRLGPIQLRYVAKDPKSNVLNAETPVPWHTVAALLQPNLLGVIVSWALLSLGAPFWYDMLKNLLKLRPAPAIAEEKQREERATQNAAPTPPRTQ